MACKDEHDSLIGAAHRNHRYVSDLIRGEAGWCLSAQQLCTVPLCGLRSGMQPAAGHFQGPAVLLFPAASSHPFRSTLLNIRLPTTQSSKHSDGDVAGNCLQAVPAGLVAVMDGPETGPFNVGNPADFTVLELGERD